MLTQGPAPDPKCKLNISSFLTLPRRLHCLTCAKESHDHCVVTANDGGGGGGES